MAREEDSVRRAVKELGRSVGYAFIRGVIESSRSTGASLVRALSGAVVAAIVALLLPKLLPSLTEPTPNAPVDLAIYLTPESGVWANPSPERSMRFETVKKSAVDDEFRLGLWAKARNLESLSAVLLGPPRWSARSISTCNGSVTPSATAVCARAINERASPVWTVTASKPGKYLYDLQLVSWTEPAEHWVAFDRPLLSGEQLRADGEVLSAGALQTLKTVATSDQPVATLPTGRFDISTGRFSASLQITNSLGLSPQAYALLSLIGVILGAILGSSVLPFLLQLAWQRLKLGRQDPKDGEV